MALRRVDFCCRLVTKGNVQHHVQTMDSDCYFVFKIQTGWGMIVDPAKSL